MKIKFTMKQNGRVSVDNKTQFDAIIVAEEQYNVVASVAKKLNKSVFDIYPDQSKVAYAVVPGEDGVKKVLRVFVIQTEDRAIKLVFESTENVSGVRMYIEDGDVLYTTAREANLAAVDVEKEENDEEITINDVEKEENDEEITINDVFGAMASIFEDLISNFENFKEKYQFKKTSATEQKEDDEDLVDGLKQEAEDEAGHACPTQRERVETLLSDARARRQKLLKDQANVLNQLKNVKHEIEQLEAELQNL